MTCLLLLIYSLTEHFSLLLSHIGIVLGGGPRSSPVLIILIPVKDIIIITPDRVGGSPFGYWLGNLLIRIGIR